MNTAFAPLNAFMVLAQVAGGAAATIPDPDPIPLPGPIWLLKGLLLLTFLLHLIPMNLVLGGGVLTVVSHLRWRRGGAAAAHHRHLAAVAARAFPATVAFTITLGVAPLLFVQVLYGQLYFTSSVLMAWPWLAVVALLLLGYYGTYWHSLRFRELGPRAFWLALGVSLTFLIIAFLFVNNLSLLQNPAVWRALYLEDPRGIHLYALRDAAVTPRFLHFLLASLAVSGLAVAGLGLAQRARDAEFAAWAGRWGVRWFAGATAAQALVGPWFLLAQPARARAAFLGASAPDAALLGAAILLAMVALAILGGGERLAPGRFAAGAGAAAATVVLMVLVRQRVRTLWLEPAFSVDRLPASPQWGAILLFAALLLAGLGLVGWMLAQFVGTRPAGR
jgi:hypothetical protein